MIKMKDFSQKNPTNKKQNTKKKIGEFEKLEALNLSDIDIKAPEGFELFESEKIDVESEAISGLENFESLKGGEDVDAEAISGLENYSSSLDDDESKDSQPINGLEVYGSLKEDEVLINKPSVKLVIKYVL